MIQTALDLELPACEQCAKPFTPREGSGGKRQRFCSTECRTAFHAENRQSSQRDNEDSQHSDNKSQRNTEQVCNVGNSPKPAPEHDIWDEDVVLHEQRETAIYWNAAGMIRQRGEVYEDDPFVVICAGNLHDFIDKLCDIAGIPSAGKRK
jgi:hypothetical protein